MVKIFVVYDSKFGNTKIVAEKIIEGLGQVEGTETAISNVKEVNLVKVTDSDAVLIGSPNHVGNLPGALKDSSINSANSTWRRSG